ncbi:hypothetical protein RHMOL_Rhmol01G0089200 [Rhododendron molle]|uniref:Uncharacterized protein n=1 Tax=Rhododendron molle TaxID=49168 RepID=A0ACC0Q0Y1_RHOML|nr:hypothetical protein RHMOL_Rhmol01G0089200 [Rhododendron molle]
MKAEMWPQVEEETWRVEVHKHWLTNVMISLLRVTFRPSRFEASELQLLKATEMTIFCGNLVSLYECGNNCKSGLSPIIDPYSCINHVLAISIDILGFICLFTFVYRPSSSKTLALLDAQRMWFWWLNPLLKQGKERILVDKEIPKLRQVDRAETCYFVLKEKLSKEKEKGTLNPSVLKTIFLWQLKAILVSGFFKLIKVLPLATDLLFLRAFILVAVGKETFKYEGYALTAGLFLGKCFESLSERQWSFRTRLIGLQIRSLLTAAIYQKQLKLSNDATTNHSPGLQICLAFFIVYDAMGTAAVAAVVVIVLTVLAYYPAAKLQHKYLAKLMVAPDRRLKAMAEALTNMKVLKLYAWETHFKNAVEKEPITMIPDVAAVFIEAKVSFSRIMKFLNAPELQNRYAKKTRDAEGLNQSISISTVRISWDSISLKPTLNDINLVVHYGEKIALCGEVGSGKSTLIAAILGEVPDINGIVQVYGEIAYVSQTVWIQTGTIQENILFGCTMDQNRYEEVLEKCSLKKDLKMLPLGDCTIIGERGVNLSGGQKQWVQLARALYKDADIYLLDDPISVVDAHTTTSLFNLVSEGKIVEAASYDQLLASSQQFQNHVNAHKVTSDSNLQFEFGFVEPKKPKEEIQKIYTERHQRETLGDLLIKEEERETGDMCLKPYIQYLKQSKGFLYLFLSVIVHCVFIIGQFVQSLWLAAHLQESSRLYFASAKELMRIDGTTKSSVASHLAESIAGAVTIRAFGEEDRFSSENLQHIDANASSFFHKFSANE